MKKQMIFLPIFSAIALAACSSDPGDSTNATDSSTTSDSSDETITMAITADIPDLNPQGASERMSGSIKFHVFETLVAPDENMDLQPLLAESYEQLDDLTWEFKLKEGISFHDDQPFNAEAVKTNFDRVLDPEIASPMFAQFNVIDEVEVIDDYTVHFITEEPFQSLPNNLSHFGGAIISPKAIEDAENGDHNLDLDPVGTGPFVFDSWTQGESINFEKNEDYWGDAVDFDALTYLIVPEQSTRIAMLDTGEVDIIDDIEPVNTGQVDAMDGASLVAVESMRSNYIGFNLDVEPLDDERVRQAFAHAIDRDTLVTGFYGEYGSKATGPISDYIFGYNPDSDFPEYDIERARELLAEAGLEDGFTTSIWLEESDSVAVQVAQHVQDQVAEIGINLEIQQLEWTTLITETTEGNHDLFLLGWSNNLGDPNDAIYRQFHSDNIGAAGNRMWYSNDEVDELLIDARKESDDAVRESMYQEVQAILAEEVPRIDYVHPYYILGVGDHIEGFEQFVSEHHSFRNASIIEN
ncbi:glutathione ABC transporter substrate-binding protein [Geomicrobium sp. JCM 19055]|uniref:glutathione ABC transporter substrate-binding protein n=1 Tax=Geomicrobium sp. JCM 19055 TaxID=1460649 RepID=UPI00045EDAD7|nr:glutathione ABC transporter substrate-binding protein [Geomicrobium sp. JCM 19055]GAJ98917.1 oligopeptide ABC transporter, periplasmic oligopeptide-binding protein OppA [Geomicrobium sp. JCM 19055]